MIPWDCPQYKLSEHSNSQSLHQVHKTGPSVCAYVCAQEAGKGKEFEALLSDIEEASLEGGALDKACNELQALVSGLKPPKQLSKEVGESDTAHRLISCC